MPFSEPKRVLSIQSHVSSGYVGTSSTNPPQGLVIYSIFSTEGNVAATFPLQVLGWDVNAINTVQYSNHAGYRHVGGSKTDARDLRAICDALEANGLMRPSRMITGYIPGGDALRAVVNIVRKQKATFPELVYLLDPVIGDEGRLYVDADVIPIYRDELLPAATIITPNWFEVEQLTNTRLNAVDGVRSALRILHGRYNVPNIVISSLVLDDDNIPSFLRTPNHETDEIFTGGVIVCLCSARSEGPGAIPYSRVHAITVPRISGYFSGVGDLFSAMILGHYDGSSSLSALSDDQGQTPISRAMTRAVNTTHAILLETQKYYRSLPQDEQPDTDEELDAKDPNRRRRRMRGRELRIIQSLELITAGGGNALGEAKSWGDFWDVRDT
ncbi:putative pyridoxal kinase [Tulasnella sp. 403]|nr:putative pyridoxal kinase [Tulasnella sp. 403]